MEPAERSADEEKSLRLFTILITIAVGGALVAAIAGVVLWLAEPESGSDVEAVLGVTAAIGGLSAGAFSIAAVIYAQVKNLWRVAPKSVRVVLWVLIGIGVALTLWSLISQPFQN